jgi:antitoxin HigA-1
MPIPNTGRMERRPTHPGEILREEYMPNLGFTIATLADALRVSRQTVNELVLERRGVSPEMALRLGRLFGQSPEFWLDLQRGVDLWDAAKALQGELEQIQPLRVA